MSKLVKINSIKACVIGHAIGDALGVPVEFMTREELDDVPVTDMTGFGTYPVPAGAWSDDTSMSLCALDSLAKGKYAPDDVMLNFGKWYYKDEFTPTGEMFDVGNTCSAAIDDHFAFKKPIGECGGTGERSNGNGSLMRIHPFVLFAKSKSESVRDSIPMIHDASALTHAHMRSKVGCGSYAFILSRLLDVASFESVRQGLSDAAEYYAGEPELRHYSRLLDPDFSSLPRESIKSDGYVVSTLEAAVWCLLTTGSYRDCVLKAISLGDDTDTVAAVAGGLAGALYGYDAIPKEWLNGLIRREYIEDLCVKAAAAWNAPAVEIS